MRSIGKIKGYFLKISRVKILHCIANRTVGSDVVSRSFKYFINLIKSYDKISFFSLTLRGCNGFFMVYESITAKYLQSKAPLFIVIQNLGGFEIQYTLASPI